VHCSSSRRGSADDRTIHRPDRCILFFHFGSPHSGLHRDRNLLGGRLRTRELGGSKERNNMRHRPDGASIRIAQCVNRHNETVYLIKEETKKKHFFRFHLAQILLWRVYNNFFYHNCLDLLLIDDTLNQT